ncbi:MAG: dephospho-CoA kinase [Blautia sp.]|nr:dephospho-CoA kinase [Blautia sp.]
MKVIGVTGGVGAGKSTVLDYMESRYGAVVIQADQIGHEVMEPGGSCFPEILALFGEKCLDDSGRIDRKWVGKWVFEDNRLLQRLNGIIHPAVQKEILQRLDRSREAGKGLCLVEAALLLEAHYESFCDEVWLVWADQETRVERLRQSRHYSREKALAIIRAQASDVFFRSHADYVIDNSDTVRQTFAQIDQRMKAVFDETGDKPI